MPSLQEVVRNVRAFVDSRNSLRQRIEQRQQKRQAMADAPPARVDIQNYMAAWTATVGADFDKAFRARLGPVLLKPNAVDLKDGGVGRVLTLAALTRNPDSEPLIGNADAALCWILKDQVATALMKIIDSMGIPYGLPRAERAAKLAELDAEIDALLAEEREMLEAASAAGVVME